MKIGIDVDGVLANFYAAYERLHIEVAGHDSFAPYGEEEGPVTWNWPMLYGYTADQTKQVWDRIKADSRFNRKLNRLPDMSVLSWWWEIVRTHDVYFVTARVGVSVKRQTEDWLSEQLALNDETPTVLIASDKAAIAKALNLDRYVDDNWHNAVAVGLAVPTCQTFLIDRAYNRPETSVRIPNDKYSIPNTVYSDLGQPYRRIRSIARMLPQ